MGEGGIRGPKVLVIREPGQRSEAGFVSGDLGCHSP